MSKEGELWRAASEVAKSTKLAIMTTADASGMPHAAWMNLLADSVMEEVICITAPNTQKIANLRANPQAEWMISSPTMETVVYLSGPTEILSDDEARKYWNSMPGKSQAYYRRYCDEDDPDKFCILRTKVTRVVYCRPPGYHKTVVHEITPEAAE